MCVFLKEINNNFTMVYGQILLYRQNISAGCFYLSSFTVKDVCRIAANALLVKRTKKKHMLGIVSYSQRRIKTTPHYHYEKHSF